MRILGPLSSGVAAGSAGSATANQNSSQLVSGEIVGIYVKYNDTPPATTDVTIKTVGTSPSPPTYNLLVRTNANTDGWFYPQVAVHDTAGAAIAGEYRSQLVHDYLNIVIAQANANDSVDVWLLLAGN